MNSQQVSLESFRFTSSLKRVLNIKADTEGVMATRYLAGSVGVQHFVLDDEPQSLPLPLAAL